MNLWTPEAFNRDFGSEKNDIVNTKSGKIIPGVPLKMFWDGFEHLSKRMLDEFGNPMLLKLKDWPSDNDIIHRLPKRFEDLMKAIPLKEYTLRTGKFNLASCIPDFFVRPDLGKLSLNYYNKIFYFINYGENIK